MSFSISYTDTFEKELKHLKKKYPNIKKDLLAAIDEIEKDEQAGDHIKNHCYKLRMPISDKPAGKSGGARIIYKVDYNSRTIRLAMIYDKSERTNLFGKELDKLLRKLDP
jgi:mRNA-degrading endonuclease RelE of RelBE toxin-antitoxin system